MEVSVAADRVVLRQILENLVSNAVKYSPRDRCRIEISLAVREGGHPRESGHRFRTQQEREEGQGMQKMTWRLRNRSFRYPFIAWHANRDRLLIFRIERIRCEPKAPP